MVTPKLVWLIQLMLTDFVGGSFMLSLNNLFYNEALQKNLTSLKTHFHYVQYEYFILKMAN